MTGPSRRTILCGTAGLFALSAGCLDEAGVSDDENGDEEPTDDDSGASGNGDESTESDDSDGNASSEDADETVESVPFSYSADADSGPDAALLIDAADATDWLDERDLEGDRLTEFVDEIDFGTTVLVGVEADAPNPCYELVLEDYDLEDEETDDGEETDADLELEAAVVDDSEGDVGCAQVETVVGRLVRAPIADDPSVSVTIDDRHGEEREISVAVDSASESASDGDGESASGNESDA